MARHTMAIGFLFASIYGAGGAYFWIKNQCEHRVWPAGLPAGGTGLGCGETWLVEVPPGSSGRFWGRTGCDFDIDGTTRGSCRTGDCGQVLECSVSGKPPSTLVEFTLGKPGTPNALDFYDVSLVDGFNLPVSLVPSNGSCKAGGCHRDLNAVCPAELKVEGGCKSACLAFDTDDFCCRNAYASDCRPSSYSRFFKSECPSAYSFARDDQTSLLSVRPEPTTASSSAPDVRSSGLVSAIRIYFPAIAGFCAVVWVYFYLDLAVDANGSERDVPVAGFVDRIEKSLLRPWWVLWLVLPLG